MKARSGRLLGHPTWKRNRPIYSYSRGAQPTGGRATCIGGRRWKNTCVGGADTNSRRAEAMMYSLLAALCATALRTKAVGAGAVLRLHGVRRMSSRRTTWET